MANEIIGRQVEIILMEKLLHSSKAELLAIYGRRRIGKTYLVKTYFRRQMIFSCSGQYKGKLREQLVHFTEQLNAGFPKEKNMLAAESWQEAFSRLKECLKKIPVGGKKVIFFDELPWLDSHKSGFLSSFSYFWNSYASERKDLIVIICGSAASWIIDKVVNNKGGLHNRITQRIRLLPFTLQETEAYLKHRKIQFDRYQLLQLYMTMGGVPAYLDAVERGKSVAQNIETICFSKDGLLTNEFENLYAALFDGAAKHIQVISALAGKNKGLTRNEIVGTGKLITGGTLSKVIQELVESGFIAQTAAANKKQRDHLYRLSDEFSLFYFKFMQPAKGSWLSQQGSSAYKSWCGYAFENICFKHIGQIKQALQIGGIESQVSSWFIAGTSRSAGAQIDLLIDRADNCINICELKFSAGPFTINKKYAAELKNKLQAYGMQGKVKKTLFLTLITNYGVTDNMYKEQLVDSEISLESLFA